MAEDWKREPPRVEGEGVLTAADEERARRVAGGRGSAGFSARELLFSRAGLSFLPLGLMLVAVVWEWWTLAVILLLIGAAMPAVTMVIAGRTPVSKLPCEGTQHGVRAGVDWIEVESDTYLLRGRWSTFTGFRIAPDMAVLTHSGRVLEAVPRRFFNSDEAWRLFIRLLVAAMGQCGRCGYSFQGLMGNTCPECGEGVERAVVRG